MVPVTCRVIGRFLMLIITHLNFKGMKGSPILIKFKPMFFSLVAGVACEYILWHRGLKWSNGGMIISQGIYLSVPLRSLQIPRRPSWELTQQMEARIRGQTARPKLVHGKFGSKYMNLFRGYFHLQNLLCLECFPLKCD
jgi:hypothetical protein